MSRPSPAQPAPSAPLDDYSHLPIPYAPVVGLLTQAAQAADEAADPQTINRLLALYRAGDDKAGRDLVLGLYHYVYEFARNPGKDKSFVGGWREELLGTLPMSLNTIVANTRNPKTKAAFTADAEKLQKLVTDEFVRRARRYKHYELPIVIAAPASTNQSRRRAKAPTIKPLKRVPLKRRPCDNGEDDHDDDTQPIRDDRKRGNSPYISCDVDLTRGLKDRCSNADQRQAVDLFEQDHSIPEIARMMNTTPYLIRKLFRQLIEITQ